MLLQFNSCLLRADHSSSSSFSGFCYINEINGPSKNYCDPSNTQWPCQAGKGYYGRGPLQISWNYNYGPAGQSIGFDGLGDPDAVARSAVVAFRAALWYWMNSVHEPLAAGGGFGATIRAINGALECGRGQDNRVADRIGFYQRYCNILGVGYGNNLECYNQRPFSQGLLIQLVKAY